MFPPVKEFESTVQSCQNATRNKGKDKWIIPLSEHQNLLNRLAQACDVHHYHLSTNIIPLQIIKSIGKWTSEEQLVENEHHWRSKMSHFALSPDNPVQLHPTLHVSSSSHSKQLFRFCLGKKKGVSTPKKVIEKHYTYHNLDEYEFSTLPKKLRDCMYPFQREGFAFALSKSGRCLIADEMGCGKSIQAIAVAYHYRSYWPLLIVTPSSLRLTWESELIKWLPECLDPHDINVISTSKDEVMDYTEYNQGLAARPKPKASVTIVSYTVLTMKQAEFSDAQFGVVICDESHYLKSSKTQRSKIILPLIKASKKALLLSGTPTNNRPAELFTQIDALRPSEFMDYHHFTSRYCDGQSGKYGWKALGAIHLNELHALLTRLCIT
ncbi:hypothetical protein RFI_19236, partial [Reticulomyxa filosa]